MSFSIFPKKRRKKKFSLFCFGEKNLVLILCEMCSDSIFFSRKNGRNKTAFQLYSKLICEIIYMINKQCLNQRIYIVFGLNTTVFCSCILSAFGHTTLLFNLFFYRKFAHNNLLSNTKGFKCSWYNYAFMFNINVK